MKKQINKDEVAGRKLANGKFAERLFVEKLREKGIWPDFIDSWYDFDVQDIKIEVKSCSLMVKGGGISKQGIGRNRMGCFVFLKKNLEQMRKENVWVCFIALYKKQYIMLGFVKAKELKLRKHLSLVNLRNYNLIDFDKWVEKYLQPLEKNV